MKSTPLTALFAVISAGTTLPLYAGELAVAPAIAQPAELATLQRERDQLVLENQLQDETVRKELAAAGAELARLRSESELARARADRELIEKRTALDKARLEMEEIGTRVSLESARRQGAMQAELAELRAAKERAELQAELAVAEFTKKSNALRTEEITWTAKLSELRTRLAVREKEIESDSYVDQRPIYLKDPLTADGALVLSDRRIPLNGPITMATADFISSRIDYFNNKNKEWPIFIVIDDSPGGSVMAGYKILKSMQSSTAPVYAVVKSFAGSMAAAIATLAERSFAYPNAIILHHQISTGTSGNLTVQREGLKTLEEWWQRLAAPIAAKMGVTTAEFVKQMYEHTATGDWKEFADNAAKLKWIDVVVGRCQETAQIRNPDVSSATTSRVATAAAPDDAVSMTEKLDAKGRPFMMLPRLNPMDCYYLYNPDGYFRME